MCRNMVSQRSLPTWYQTQAWKILAERIDQKTPQDGWPTSLSYFPSPIKQQLIC